MTPLGQVFANLRELQSDFGTQPNVPPPANSLDQYLLQLRRNFTQHLPVARPGPYETQLSPAGEQAFRQWVASNQVPFNPDQDMHDYDMRGFYQAVQAGDPAAASGINPYDQQLHFSDEFKTPADLTFSNESRYATPNAPHWEYGRYLIGQGGNILFDAAKNRGG